MVKLNGLEMQLETIQVEAQSGEQLPFDPFGDVPAVDIRMDGGGGRRRRAAARRRLQPGRGPRAARVVLSPADATVRPGEVLVAATTDPGWIFLMAGAAALVAERGNPLSHTAIVGRELGLPTVVGVAGATRLLATGETLVVDGAAGTVRRVVVADAAAPAVQSARP